MLPTEGDQRELLQAVTQQVAHTADAVLPLSAAMGAAACCWRLCCI